MLYLFATPGQSEVDNLWKLPALPRPVKHFRPSFAAIERQIFKQSAYRLKRVSCDTLRRLRHVIVRAGGGH